MVILELRKCSRGVRLWLFCSSESVLGGYGYGYTGAPKMFWGGGVGGYGNDDNFGQNVLGGRGGGIR